MEQQKELFVRIPLQNIKFSDSYEQHKFEKMKSSNSKEAIKAFEESLKHFNITISYHLQPELTNLPKGSRIVKDDKEVKVTQESIDCVVMHVKTFHEQAIEEEKANFVQPCELCKKNKNCNFDWIGIMSPIFDNCDNKIKMGYAGRSCKQDKNHENL